MKSQLGFIGLGKIGLPIAKNMLKTFDVVGFDVSGDYFAFKEAGGSSTSGLDSLVETGVDVIFLSLPNGAVIDQVVFGTGGLVDHGFAGTIVDLSTIGPDEARRLSSSATSHGIAWADSPVSGGVAGAERAALAVILACSDAIRSKIRQPLEQIGTIYAVGTDPGMAQIAKLSNNFLSAVSMMATSEALSVSTHAGIDPEIMLSIMAVGTGSNTAVTDKFPNSVINRRFSHGFTLEMMLKDMQLFEAASEAEGVPLTAGHGISDVWKEAKSKYSGSADFTNIVRVYEELTGVVIEAHRFKNSHTPN